MIQTELRFRIQKETHSPRQLQFSRMDVTVGLGSAAKVVSTSASSVPVAVVAEWMGVLVDTTSGIF